eukprot:1330905-Prymnesium_polylepis.2
MSSRPQIDCWDGPKKDPVVTHGNTFCSKATFESVAEAIAECAFTTSEFPVVMSLEVTPPQKFKSRALSLLAAV